MPKWIGPFTVSKLVGTVAVKLDLPHPWTIHPVFHLLLIKPHHANGSVQPPGRLAYIDGDPQYAVDYILNQRIAKKGRKSETQYLIRLSGWGPAHDTWESESNIDDPELIRSFISARSPHS